MYFKDSYSGLDSSELIFNDHAQIVAWPRLGADNVFWLPSNTGDNFAQLAKLPADEEGFRHGGIPLVGPWFAKGKKQQSLPHHGWFHHLKWKIIKQEKLFEANEIEFSCIEALPPVAELRLKIKHCAQSLSLALIVKASADFELEMGFHTYFALNHIHETKLFGLNGVKARDAITGESNLKFARELRFNKPTDLVFEAAPKLRLDLGANNGSEASRSKPYRAIEITSDTANSTVVWNPYGEARATEFLCVESAAVEQGAIRLKAEQSHRLEVNYQLIK